MATRPVEIQITVGRFVLRLGSVHGTRAEPASEPEPEQAEALAGAFVGPPPVNGRSATDAVVDAVSEAQEATAAVERATELVETLAKGLTLDPKTLEKQANILLGLLDRADREGRWEDERRLARAVVTLLALIPRWIALVEVLRRAASAAAAVGDRATEAWANHEVGSFALAADDLPTANSHLTRALDLRNSLGDAAGAEQTLQNLRMLGFAQPTPRRVESMRRGTARHPLVAGLVALAVLGTAGGLAAGAVVWSRDDDNANDEAQPATVPDQTTTQPNETTAGDTVAPIALITAPGPLVRDVVELAALARDAGGSGVEAVVFEVAPAGTGAWQRLGSTVEQPYSLAWDTRTLGDGPYELRVTATDGAGNAASSSPIETVVDNSAPAVVIESPLDPASGSITLSAEADDGDGSGVQLVVFELGPGEPDAPDAWEEIGTTTAGPPFQFVFDTTTKPDGSYQVRAQALDNAGNTGVSPPALFTIDQPGIVE